MLIGLSWENLLDQLEIHVGPVGLSWVIELP